jgi:hypothetical protein
VSNTAPAVGGPGVGHLPGGLRWWLSDSL